jgi:hypothetical protein
MLGTLQSYGWELTLQPDQTGAHGRTKSKLAARIRKSAVSHRETLPVLTSDDLQSENADLKVEIRSKDEMIARLRAALGMMGVQNDRSAREFRLTCMARMMLLCCLRGPV